ncbi:hypothetical protein [Bacillus massilinigeriensis]|uniref:hypothetical protein n=1 Tax=Bacillus mediterraneensis TaxID=1805474 RepID=UPI0009F666A4|nr:hypothetical protein [Bacillus mediterraneensis]
MKSTTLATAAAILLLTPSCSIVDKSAHLRVDHDVKQVVFLSDDANYRTEDAYYDAIIELKKDYPKEMENMLILPTKNAKKYYKQLEVDEGPALLILHKEKIKAKVAGNATKNQIMKPISKGLENKN